MSEIVKFEKVKKTFQDGDETIEALKESSFSINSGELIAIIGSSGSGKSTLLTIMGGLQKPSEGKILFNGEDITSLSEKDRNNLRFDKIGFILQASNLVPYLSIEEQFELVDKFKKKKFDKDKAEKLMEKFDILKRKKQYPGDLSGGERQRAAIARALYPEPKLILADEPTASLDTERAIKVVEILKDITRESDRTTVMVTHDNRLLEYCDRVFKITDGKLTEE
ncbi:ABC transporter ATP-binding protein [Helcococcus kunzii]|uniref:ABC transporter ATP-binding protein n=1 Tax=Helcococcus kunzii TaxID=40091 RepID=UPI0021A2F71C|nr:ABC transporter ATP-binding protein [Helcococcus kunzii]MCT1796523.1 ABC transporter ATP-binding protein [Helcococcus kunzii]MCT1988335.1 ABC transporter ATP-binding protein [Helcococcus kunzii]